MDLRKYIGKTVIPDFILRHNYLYYSHGSGENSPACLIVIVDKNEGTPTSPDYEIKFSLTQFGKIRSAERLAKYWGTGYLIKSFPKEVDERATTVLSEIVSNDGNNRRADLSALFDRYTNLCDKQKGIPR